MPVSLDDSYTAESGRVLISGIQAIVRLLLDQRRLDTARGLDTRIFVSGYQGSPLGGLDQELHRTVGLLEPAGVIFQPGLNEELAATAVAGSQLVPFAPGRRHAGVTGFWFGKNPGLDRAADAIRHANLVGASAFGGAVALIGDDPASKSSTVPSACEQMCQSLAVPLLAPTSVSEIISFGLHAVALSRASGLWAGLKIVADIADASTTMELRPLGLGHPAAEPDRSGQPAAAARPGRGRRRVRRAHPPAQPGPPVRPRRRPEPDHVQRPAGPARRARLGPGLRGRAARARRPRPGRGRADAARRPADPDRHAVPGRPAAAAPS